MITIQVRSRKEQLSDMWVPHIQKTHVSACVFHWIQTTSRASRHLRWPQQLHFWQLPSREFLGDVVQRFSKVDDMWSSGPPDNPTDDRSKACMGSFEMVFWGKTCVCVCIAYHLSCHTSITESPFIGVRYVSCECPNIMCFYHMGFPMIFLMIFKLFTKQLWIFPWFPKFSHGGQDQPPNEGRLHDQPERALGLGPSGFSSWNDWKFYGKSGKIWKYMETYIGISKKLCFFNTLLKAFCEFYPMEVET